MGLRLWLARARERSHRSSDVALTVLAAATVFLVVAVVLDGPGPSTSSLTTDDALSPLPTFESLAAEPPPPSPASPDPASPGPSAAADPSRPAGAAPDPVATGSGVRLNVSAAPDGALRVRVTIRVRDDDGAWNGGVVTFGDGTRHTFPTTSRCATGSRSTDVTRAVSHRYSRAGTYSVSVTVRTDRPCSATRAETATRGVRVTVSRAATTTAPTSAAPRPTTASARPTPAPTRSSPRATPPPSPTPSPTPEPSSEHPSPEPSPEPSQSSDAPSPQPTGDDTAGGDRRSRWQ